ncbi:MAG: hypothetical protein R3A48_21815 [Polyangiales bacterium]
MRIWRVLALAAFAALAAGCDEGTPQGWRSTPAGDGPRVTWNLEYDTLPLIPLPNDVATWPDPTSPTGRRINASVLVPTGIERMTRSRFNELDGWATFGPITIPFDGEINLEDLMRRQGGTERFHQSDFPNHAVYLIDLETGLPVPLDLNSGNFPYAVTHTDQYQENDPRSTESNLLFETVDEDTNRNGVLDPGEDTDFDGVLDRPNTLDGRLNGTPNETVDRMAWFYERESHTLIVRPLLPLRPRRTYAVVLTNRLVGANGSPVRSPFDHVHHVRQTDTLAALPRHLTAHPELYGSLATAGWGDIAFAWSFTTQSVTDDLDTVRAGLYGRGPMARLATEFPADAAPMPMQGGPNCPAPGARTYVATGDQFRATLTTLGPLLGLSPAQTQVLGRSYANLSHVVTVLFDTPFLLGDPERERRDDIFDIDWQTGRARVNRETIAMTLFIPQETAERRQPFAPLIFMHGHGSNSGEILGYGGLVLQHGHALVTLNAPGHGLELSPAIQGALRGAFGAQCISGAATAMTLGRARDLNGDMSLDSGADYWTAYLFHTRDSVRQTIIDEMQAIRVLRSFDGRPARPVTMLTRTRDTVAFDGDTNRDGSPDIAGDFDGNGRPDLGGPNSPFYSAGGSLGGIVTAMLAGSEPAVTASVPVVGGGGLADIAIRTENGAVLGALVLRVMGPLVTTVPSMGPGRDTSCAAGDVSLGIVAPDLTKRTRTEFACLPAADLSADDLLVVRNLTNGEVECSGNTGNVAGRFRVPVPSDANDRWEVSFYRHGRDKIRFGSCQWIGAVPQPDRVIRTWEVGAPQREAGCRACAQFNTLSWELGAPLVAPTAGFGRRRQTPEFRRLVMLAQMVVERGDPINYARRVFLEPITAPEVPVRPRSMLVTNTTGDPNVTISTGYALARAAGIVPFLPPDAPAHLAEFRAPASFAGRYPGSATPNDVYLNFHAIEGLSRLARHPAPGGMGDTFLVDVDDLSDGRQYFNANARDQLAMSMGGVQPVTLGRNGVGSGPLRWSRRSRPMAQPGEDAVFTYANGTPTSGMVSPYVQPRGIHGFSEIYNDDIPFDMAVYMFSMTGRYLFTGGTEIPYLADPTGHHCLENSTCDYLR